MPTHLLVLWNEADASNLLYDLQWQEKGDVDVDIGANPSAEGGDEEGVESNTQKVVDLIDAFRLNVGSSPTRPMRSKVACIAEKVLKVGVL